MYSSITPLEIRQKEFEKGFRGYEKEEVDAFLKSLSQEWERMIGEYKNLEEKYRRAEEDVDKLREVESSLFKALKTAEDTGASMIDQANKSAILQIKEAKMEANSLVADAKKQSRNLIEDAEATVREINSELRDQIKQCENDFRTIEDKRDNLLIELRSLANDTLERVVKHQEKGAKLNVTEMIESINKQEEATDRFAKKLQEELKEDIAPEVEEKVIETVPVEDTETYEFEINTQFEAPEEESISKVELKMEEERAPEQEENKNKGRNSFFDDL